MKLSKKQQYHLEPPQGLMNDPNGLVWFQGRYYVFFQWNRFRKDHSYKEWGLFTSRDLVRWEFRGGAIRPGSTWDQSGVHSGSALVIDGQLCAFYTGSDKSGGKRRSSQCLAVSRDGRTFAKQGVFLHTPEGFTEHFRDPKAFPAPEGGYDLVLGGQRTSGKGAVVLCRSRDGFRWHYSHILAFADDHEMVECPDLFRLDGQDLLLYCPQRRDPESDQVISSQAVYKPVDFDPHTGVLGDQDLETGFSLLDQGFDFYAPQTFLAPDGRRILTAWMSRMEDEQERIFGEEEPRIHCLTLPRELAYRGGRLCQLPVRELYQLPVQSVSVQETAGGGFTARLTRRTWRLHLEMTSAPAGLHLELGECSLHWDGSHLRFIRQNWADHGFQERLVSLEMLESIEIWSDVSSIEIFINGGSAVFSARIFPDRTAPEIRVTGTGRNVKPEILEILADAGVCYCPPEASEQ